MDGTRISSTPASPTRTSASPPSANGPPSVPSSVTSSSPDASARDRDRLPLAPQRRVQVGDDRRPAVDAQRNPGDRWTVARLDELDRIGGDRASGAEHEARLRAGLAPHPPCGRRIAVERERRPIVRVVAGRTARTRSRPPCRRAAPRRSGPRRSHPRPRRRDGSRCRRSTVAALPRSVAPTSSRNRSQRRARLRLVSVTTSAASRARSASVSASRSSAVVRSTTARPSSSPAAAASTIPSPLPASTTGRAADAVCTICCGSSTGKSATGGGSASAASVASIASGGQRGRFGVSGPNASGDPSPGASGSVSQRHSSRAAACRSARTRGRSARGPCRRRASARRAASASRARTCPPACAGRARRAGRRPPGVPYGSTSRASTRTVDQPGRDRFHRVPPPVRGEVSCRGSRDTRAPSSPSSSARADRVPVRGHVLGSVQRGPRGSRCATPAGTPTTATAPTTTAAPRLVRATRDRARATPARDERGDAEHDHRNDARRVAEARGRARSRSRRLEQPAVRAGVVVRPRADADDRAHDEEHDEEAAVTPPHERRR